MNNFSLYLHIPFCISKCDYCDFFSIPCKNQGVPEEYVEALCNEISFRVKEYKEKNPDCLCKSVYMGGGTPSLLKPEQFNQIFKAISENTSFTRNYEFTVEMNPDDITEELLSFLDSSVITRISCGIQSLNDKVLKNMHRRAGKAENIRALDLLNAFWHKTLSLDLISALPLEDETEFLENLKTICSYNPHHISLYSLTIEEETPLGKQFESGILDYDFDFADKMWLLGKKLLEQQGFYQYEVSNFAKKGYQCGHNLTYWRHENYIGCGSGATGTVYNSDGTGCRITNVENIQKYCSFWKNNQSSLDEVQIVENVDLETSIFEFFMMGLRTLEGVSKNHFISCFNKPFPEKIIDEFEKWEKEGLSEIKQQDNDVIYRLNHKGILYLNKFLENIL